MTSPNMTLKPSHDFAAWKLSRPCVDLLYSTHDELLKLKNPSAVHGLSTQKSINDHLYPLHFQHVPWSNLFASSSCVSINDSHRCAPWGGRCMHIWSTRDIEGAALLFERSKTTSSYRMILTLHWPTVFHRSASCRQTTSPKDWRILYKSHYWHAVIHRINLARRCCLQIYSNTRTTTHFSFKSYLIRSWTVLKWLMEGSERSVVTNHLQFHHKEVVLPIQWLTWHCGSHIISVNHPPPGSIPQHQLLTQLYTPFEWLLNHPFLAANHSPGTLHLHTVFTLGQQRQSEGRNAIPVTRVIRSTRNDRGYCPAEIGATWAGQQDN